MKKDILWSLEVSDGRIRNKIVGTDHDNAEDIAAIVSYFFDFCRELFPDNNFLIHNINKFLSVIPPPLPPNGGVWLTYSRVCDIMGLTARKHPIYTRSHHVDHAPFHQ